MNQDHIEGLSSDAWAEYLRTELLPWVFEDGVALGDDVVEIGPGPGRTTELLQERFDRLTAVEIDDGLAAALAARFADSERVRVHHGDGAAMPFADGSFSGACSFIMLHHVPTAEHQDRLLREVRRVLRPGGVFVGADGTPSDDLAARHVGDTYNPIDPSTLPQRLAAAGFSDVVVGERPGRFKFEARVPTRR